MYLYDIDVADGLGLIKVAVSDPLQIARLRDFIKEAHEAIKIKNDDYLIMHKEDGNG